MGKISEKVSKGLGEAIKEAQTQLIRESSESSTEELLNSGVKAQKKRHRRTKAEIEAAKAAEENDLFKAIIPEEDNRPEWEKRSAKDHDEFCEWELQKAAISGKPDPDFDFRHYYTKGDTVYFVRYMPTLGEKEVMKLYLRTIYPRCMIGVVAKQYCEVVGYNERDMIFLTEKEALDLCKTLPVSNKFGTEYDENGKKKRKSSKQPQEVSEDIDEDIIDEDIPDEMYIYKQESEDE